MKYININEIYSRVREETLVDLTEYPMVLLLDVLVVLFGLCLLVPVLHCIVHLFFLPTLFVLT